MARYVTLPVVVSPVALTQRAYTFLQALMPSWQPAEGNLDVWLLEATSTETAELINILSLVPDTIFQYFGSSLMAITPISAQAALGHTTWYMHDDLGHVIPAGTQIAIRDSAGNLIPFITVNDGNVGPGETQTSIGGVTVSAAISGSIGNDLVGPVELLDILAYVDHVELSDVTGGGVDGESDDDYMNRLTTELQLLTRTPILPDDFAIIARGIPPAYRAVALDTYDPVADTFGNPRMVTIIAIDQAGEAVDAATKNNIRNTLDSMREVNFIVNTTDPTYTTINVSCQVQVAKDFDSPSVISNVIDAINTFLFPGNWGVPTQMQGTSSTGDPRDWINTTILRKYDLSQAIHAVSGVQTIVPPLLLAKVGDTLAEDDITLNGRICLPRAGTINVVDSLTSLTSRVSYG